MPRTMLCPNCGAILNLPAQISAGKRLKCPKCGHRFQVSERDASSASTAPGIADAAMASSHDLSRRPPDRDELPLPVADRDLREMFDQPLATGSSIEQSAATSGPALTDAEALFREPPARKRKVEKAEARSQARRCISCGGLVPIGMSTCVSCGLDQESGLRIDLDDDLVPPPPPPSLGPPLHVAIIGFLCGLSAVILLVLALVQTVRVEPGLEQYGWICLALVSAFGIYAAVQFYTGKTSKLLMLALTLGVIVDLVALVAVPIAQANFEARERVVIRSAVRTDDNTPLELENVKIRSVAERLDQQKLTLGFVIVLIYALLSVYLMSPAVKKYFIRQEALASGAFP